MQLLRFWSETSAFFLLLPFSLAFSLACEQTFSFSLVRSVHFAFFSSFLLFLALAFFALAASLEAFALDALLSVLLPILLSSSSDSVYE